MTPPHDILAEQSLLASLLIDPRRWNDVGPMVSPASFYRIQHSSIFESMGDVLGAGMDLDIVSLRNAMETRGVLDDCGGVSYLMQIADFLPTASNVMTYAKLVRDAYAKRVCILEAQKAMDSLAVGEDDTFKVVERMIQNVEHAITPVRQAVHLDEIVSPEVEDIVNRKGGGRGISTGLHNIDRITHGFRPGEFSIIGARPSMGKSALALQMANQMARRGVPVLYVSIEMSQSMVAQRMISYTTGIDSGHLANGMLDAWQKQQVIEARANLQTMPFYVSAHSPCDMSLIKSMANRLKRSADIKVVFVDYLQMIDGGGTDNRTREVGIISRGLKSLAKEHDVAVVALSSLSRRVEARDDKRPVMSDLRESGDIESDADLVTFLYRPMYYADPDQKEGLTDEECEFIVSKNRNGPIGTAKLTFFSARATFDDAADMGVF